MALAVFESLLLPLAFRCPDRVQRLISAYHVLTRLLQCLTAYSRPLPSRCLHEK